MARLESIAVGGYYKTPTHLLPRIAKIVEPYYGSTTVSLMDPCVGDGEAIVTLSKAWVKHAAVSLYTCEMEATRSVAFKKRCDEEKLSTRHHLHGDAFKVSMEVGPYGGVSVLYLNPPYDTDRTHGRLEHKFLNRFTPAVTLDGVLLFVVPYYALKASAAYLATEYNDLQCFKFPSEDFKAYKQIVLCARKTETRMRPNKRLEQQVLGWAANPDVLPELPNIASDPVAQLPGFDRYRNHHMTSWHLNQVDINVMAKKADPWMHSLRAGNLVPVHGVLPDVPIKDLLLRKYPVATPPRPAHIAAGIASGIFNGSKIKPTDPKSKLPEVLIKGAFDQEWRTIEEKIDKSGDVTGVVQIQQPKLVVTVLDLTTHKYHTLGHGSSTKEEISELTISGLLKHYGDSLMEVMENQCPILYDPRKDGDSVELAPTERTLFTAQQHATKALIKLLGGPDIPIRKRRGKGAILLGEIGCGKTTVATTLAHTIKSKRPLVLCPPHLLKSWQDEVEKVLPGTEIRVLDSVSALQELEADKRNEPIFSIMSREAAKLSHGWEGIKGACPKCGSETPKGDLGKKRAKCGYQKLIYKGPIAELVVKLSRQIVKYEPDNTTARKLLTSRLDLARIRKFERVEKEDRPLFPGFSATYFDSVIDPLVKLIDETQYQVKLEQYHKTLLWVLAHSGDKTLITKAAAKLLESENYWAYDIAENVLLMLPPNGKEQKEFLSTHNRPRSYNSYYYDSSNPWGRVKNLAKSLADGGEYNRIIGIPIQWVNGALFFNREKIGSLEAAESVLQALAYTADFRVGKKCGEILYQASPSPKRVALAKYIHHYHPNLFDFLILDEAHEYSNNTSAQAISAHRLTGLGIPTLEMTGSIMNGYAESLFMIMWAISSDFRREFDRSEKQRFIDRYGYRKRLVQEKNYDGEVVEFGSMSDRVMRSERMIGNAPGVLPLFLLRHLLPISVTLHKDDLALDLPRCVQEKHLIQPDKELGDRYRMLQRVLVDRIKKDQFNKELAGKLFGQLAELPSYLDRSTKDTGNTKQGDFEIRYPDSVGGEVIESQSPFPADMVMAKEQWMLDRISQELEEGRNVMVFSWHVTVLPRLQSLIETHLGLKAPILYANKVSTAKRQDWINKQVVGKGARVMLTNPVAIQTGLNNLVHFATEIWMENPACNPIVFRQAIGRVDRIGQRVETRILSPIYADTIQETTYDLLLKKVAVSISTDGLDPESAMLAAGIGTDEFLTGLSIGKQLWAMLSDGYVEAA